MLNSFDVFDFFLVRIPASYLVYKKRWFVKATYFLSQFHRISAISLVSRELRESLYWNLNALGARTLSGK